MTCSRRLSLEMQITFEPIAIWFSKHSPPHYIISLCLWHHLFAQACGLNWASYKDFPSYASLESVSSSHISLKL